MRGSVGFCLGMPVVPSPTQRNANYFLTFAGVVAVVLCGLIGRGICLGSSYDPEPTTKPDALGIITASTDTPAGAATTRPATAPLFTWDITWRGWDGLSVDLSDRLVTVPELLGLTTRPEEGGADTRFSLHLGGRLEVDGAAYDTSGNLHGFRDKVEIRRAEITADGMFRLIVPMGYKVQLAYAPSGFYVKEAYLLSPYIDYIGNIKIGIITPPMGLDLVTSSRDIAFMEPAAPTQALAPANEAGIEIGHPVFDERATWMLGAFGNGYNSGEYGTASKNYGNILGRVTGLPIDHLNPEHPSENEYLHLGLSGGYQYSTTDTIRYRSRPESYIAPYVVDTGEINASSATTIGAEAAWVNGPWTVQGEFLDSLVDAGTGNVLNFDGFYVFVSYFLTGESRVYDPLTAAYSRVIPLRNFDFGHGGWGAVELGCRYSYTDLSDGAIQGGRLGELMGEVNWYLHPHIKWMFGAGYGHVTGSPSHGDLFLVQTRVGVDF